MISRRIPMRDAKQSSFSGLAKYISSSQEKQERVGDIRLTNFQNESLDWAIREALAVQQRNQRAEGDKTYHLLISFAPGEQPSAEVLRDIEDRLCTAIGFGEHQRISAVHHDTDNLHIHVAINKIHPERHTIHEPYRDYKVRSQMCALLEREHGLQITNQISRKRGSENGADDMEQHAGIESLLGWIKRECVDQITQSQSWNELHEVMRSNGLELKEQGNGLVITDGRGIGVKASSVSRTLSKPNLEKRLGSFERNAKRTAQPRRDPRALNRPAPPVGKIGVKPPPFRKGRLNGLSQLGVLEGEAVKRYEGRPIHNADSTGTTELYARYKAEQAIKIHARSIAWVEARNRKDKATEAVKRIGRLKRTAIKLLKGHGVNKKALYSLTSKTLHSDIQKINAEYLAERQAIHSSFTKKAWADWLQAKASDGDQEALQALRSRKGGKGRTGNNVAGSGPVKRSGPMPLKADSVTKDGTIIHRFAGDAIRDDGNALQVSRGSSQVGLEAVLRMAMHRYGQNISVNGTAEFKEKIARVAATSKLNITFDDAALEARRQALVRSISKESGNDRRKSDRSADERRRPVSSNAAGSREQRGGRAERTGVRRGPGQTNQPGIRGFGATKPPTMPRNSLRELPELGVVRVSERSEVLLPRDVPHNVQHKGTEHAGSVRRSISGARGRIEPSPRGPGSTNKPGVIPVGGKPPAMMRGRLPLMSSLRELSADGTIRVPGLLSQGKIEPVHQKPESTKLVDQSAADKYIAERASKQSKGFDIPNHRRYNQDDKGAALFAGTRQVEGETLALLKRDEEIIVLPVDAATARRIKRYSLGDAVTLSGKGAITRKGRSR